MTRGPEDFGLTPDDVYYVRAVVRDWRWLWLRKRYVLYR